MKRVVKHMAHQQDVGDDGPVHGQEGLSEEDEHLTQGTQETHHTTASMEVN